MVFPEKLQRVHTKPWNISVKGGETLRPDCGPRLELDGRNHDVKRWPDLCVFESRERGVTLGSIGGPEPSAKDPAPAMAKGDHMRQVGFQGASELGLGQGPIFA